MVFRIYYVSHAIQCDSAAPERHSTKSAPGGVKDAETLRGISRTQMHTTRVRHMLPDGIVTSAILNDFLHAIAISPL
jgi:UTP:GlnB (protein PII) uridylyltransferase